MNTASNSDQKRFSILIPTRNRPAQLLKLLDSINQSTCLPDLVVIVSTGDDLTAHLAKVRFKFEIDYLHVEGFGQIRQKLIGISRIPKSSKWIAFLDDDLEVGPDCFQNLFQALNSDILGENIVGMGMAEQLGDSRRNYIFRKYRSRLSGKVLKNGRNVSYMQSRSKLETEWLNGASIWRKDVLTCYSFPYTQSRYSICEDLIFSYSARKFGRLIFVPEAQYWVQKLDKATPNSFDLRAFAFWKYYFVKINQELSVILFYVSYLGLTLKYLFKRQSEGRRTSTLKTLAILTKTILAREEPLTALMKYKI